MTRLLRNTALTLVTTAVTPSTRRSSSIGNANALAANAISAKTEPTALPMAKKPSSSARVGWPLSG
jgi:hypothetical protein